MNRLQLVAVGSLLLLVCPAVAEDAEAPTFPLWPGEAPGEKGDIGQEKLLGPRPGQIDVERLTNVTRPRITVYKPPKDKDTGAAVLICPGGGYHILATSHEGRDVATWLNTLGVTGVLLEYRVPRRKDRPPHEAPLQDAQRAMGMVRHNAGKWGIDANRIGVLGFSAGGHLAAATATNFDKRAYEPIDEIDKVNSRPDFAVLIYPGYIVDKDGKLSDTIPVTQRTPPCFFVHAHDDRLTSENSIVMYLALKKAGVGAELHIYDRGGHGFGMMDNGVPTSTWPGRCADWLKANGWLKSPGKSGNHEAR